MAPLLPIFSLKLIWTTCRASLQNGSLFPSAFGLSSLLGPQNLAQPCTFLTLIHTLTSLPLPLPRVDFVR